jgi:hypothetical protein
MTRCIDLLRRRRTCGFAMLTLCLLSLEGCSEGGANAGGSATGGLEESDIIAIEKTAKTSKAFREVLKQKRMEKAGIVRPTEASAKAKKTAR